jgi:hypothetical protein
MPLPVRFISTPFFERYWFLFAVYRCCRHEMPTAPDSAVAKQNYRPAAAAEDATAAQSVLRRMESLQTIEPPGDRSIMHLFVGGVLEEFCSETDLRCAHCRCLLGWGRLFTH